MPAIELDLDKPSKEKKGPSQVLTIGTFDGVHLGHQALLRRSREEAKRLKANLGILTFKTPPSWVLFPERKKPLLISLEERIERLEAMGPDSIFLLEFTKEMAALTVEEFFFRLKKHFTIVKIILGHDATLGSDQEGNRENILKAAKKMGFQVEFLPPVLFKGMPVSSSFIRKCLEQGLKEEASELMGDPH